MPPVVITLWKMTRARWRCRHEASTVAAIRGVVLGPDTAEPGVPGRRCPGADRRGESGSSGGRSHQSVPGLLSRLDQRHARPQHPARPDSRVAHRDRPGYRPVRPLAGEKLGHDPGRPFVAGQVAGRGALPSGLRRIYRQRRGAQPRAVVPGGLPGSRRSAVECLPDRYLHRRARRGGQRPRGADALQRAMPGLRVLLLRSGQRHDVQQGAVGQRRRNGLRAQAGRHRALRVQRTPVRPVRLVRTGTDAALETRRGGLERTHVDLDHRGIDALCPIAGGRDASDGGQQGPRGPIGCQGIQARSQPRHGATDTDRLRRPLLRHGGPGDGALHGTRRHQRQAGPEPPVCQEKGAPGHEQSH